jgi:hypothetical protein
VLASKTWTAGHPRGTVWTAKSEPQMQAALVTFDWLFCTGAWISWTRPGSNTAIGETAGNAPSSLVLRSVVNCAGWLRLLTRHHYFEGVLLVLDQLSAHVQGRAVKRASELKRRLVLVPNRRTGVGTARIRSLV